MASAQAPASVWRELISKEDWWAIWIGLGLVIAAVFAFSQGASLKWIAVAPQKWSTFADLGTQFAANWPRFLALFALFAVLFGIGIAALGLRIAQFVPAFATLFLVSLAIYTLGQWDQAARYNLEAPLVALALGLLVSNIFA